MRAREANHSLYSKTQSLEVSNKKIKEGSDFTYQGTNMDVLKKLIASEQDEPMMARHEPRRNRERSYFIRDNKVSSAARIN